MRCNLGKKHVLLNLLIFYTDSLIAIAIQHCCQVFLKQECTYIVHKLFGLKFSDLSPKEP